MIFPCERSIFRGDFKYGGSRNHLTFRETFHVFFFWIDYISRLVPIQSYSIWVVSPTTDCKLMAPSLCLQPWWSCDVHKIQKINMRSSLFIGILAKIPEKTRRRYIYIYLSLSEINLPYPFMVDFWTMAPDSTVRPQLCTSSWCIAPILRPPLGSAVDGFKSPWRQRNIHWKRRYYIYIHIYIYTGCWFQTFFCFP
jgi:hypothetical protein